MILKGRLHVPFHPKNSLFSVPLIKIKYICVYVNAFENKFKLFSATNKLLNIIIIVKLFLATSFQLQPSGNASSLT